MRISSDLAAASRFTKFVTVASLAFCMAACVYAQSRPLSPVSTVGGGISTITVYIRNEQGQPISAIPTLSLRSTSRGEIPGYAQQFGEGWVFRDVEAGDEYEVEVKADGYQTGRQTVMLPPDTGNANVIVFLQPADEQLNFHPPTGQFVLAPRAQKEVEKGMKDLRDDKVPSAQKHFVKALAMAPGNPYVNYLVGMSYLLAKQLSNARPYLEKSVSIDPKEPAALLALGTLRFQSADYMAPFRY